MQKWLLFLFPVFLSPGLPSSPQPATPAGWPDWAAPSFEHLDQHPEFFHRIVESGPENTMALCIGMPELIRYALFRDYFETAALETLYLRYGTDGADYSIGWFQMKPSFAETLEDRLQKTPALAARFAGLFDASSDQHAARRARLDRLQDPDMQFRYLQAFVAVMNEQHAEHLFASQEAKLRTFATVYNGGLHLSESEIKRYLNAQHFPFGPQSNVPQMAYGDLAVHYWHYLPSLY